jgi:hypothetical protein
LDDALNSAHSVEKEQAQHTAPLFPPQALHHTRIEGALRINARKGATTLRTLNNHPIPLV